MAFGLISGVFAFFSLSAVVKGIFRRYVINGTFLTLHKPSQPRVVSRKDKPLAYWFSICIGTAAGAFWCFLVFVTIGHLLGELHR